MTVVWTVDSSSVDCVNLARDVVYATAVLLFLFVGDVVLMGETGRTKERCRRLSHYHEIAQVWLEAG